MNKNGRLYVRCGTLNDIKTKCVNPALVYWEQAYFKKLFLSKMPKLIIKISVSKHQKIIRLMVKIITYFDLILLKMFRFSFL